MYAGRDVLVKRSIAVLLTLVLVCSALVALSRPAEASAGGPDTWGYRWVDSVSPAPVVSFDWIELYGAGTDTGLSGDDVCTSPIEIGFPFEFYGNTYDMVNLTTNGFAIFDFESTSSYGYPMPTPWYEPQNFIAPFWDDLIVNDGWYNTGSVLYSTIGAAPDRQFVAEWYEVSLDYEYDLLTFELILNETGEMWFQYLELSGVTGWSTAVGIENYDGTVGLEYSYHEEVLTDGLAVCFEPYPIGISADQTFRAFPGDTLYFAVDVRNAQASTDSFDVTASSENGWEVQLLDGAFNPLLDENLNGLPDTGDVAAESTSMLYVQVDVPMSPSLTDTTTVTVQSYSDPTAVATTLLNVVVNAAEFIDVSTSDWGIDFDTDGLYDLLAVYTEVEAYFEDELYVDARLYTSVGNYVGDDYGYVDASVGANGIVFYFEGADIFAIGDPGPFRVEFAVYDYYSWADSQTYMTSAYDYTDFEPPMGYMDTPFVETALDLDADTLYDALSFDVTVHVEEDGYYRIEAELGYASSTLEHLTPPEMFLTAGSNVVTLACSGFSIGYTSTSGPYTLNARLYDHDTSELLDTANHTTAAYLYTEFTTVWGSFLPPYSDYGDDDDADGLYERLVIEVDLDMVSPGEYQLYVDLFDETDTYYVAYDFVDAQLAFGTNTVQFEFPAYELIEQGFDGPFVAYVGLYTSVGYSIAWDSYLTSAYTLDEFDGTPIALAPPHDDFGYDNDLDGAFDFLYVEVNFDVYEYGDYTIVGELLSPTAVPLGTSTYNDFFWDGWNYVDLEFAGGPIYNNGEDGPYTVEIGLYDEYDTLLDTGTHLTDAYAATDFDEPAALFAPPHSDSGFDEDSDGMYEWLSVNVSLEVFLDGWYYVDAYAVDMYDTYLTDAYYGEYLVAGALTVQLLFDSTEFYENGVDGPYTVHMYLYDEWGTYLQGDMHTTAAYLFEDFEGYGAMFDTPFDVRTEDYDSDGLYDYIEVDVTVNVSIAGEYEVAAYLETDYGYYIDGDYDYETCAVGDAVFTMYFPGDMVFATLHDGMFQVTAYLYDSEGYVLDAYAQDIGPYDHTEFEMPPAYFAPPHSDHGEDYDSDGLVDHLVVEVGVNVTAAGDYRFVAWMYDEWGAYVGTALNETTLEVGDDQTVEVVFDMWFAWANGEDCSYDVIIEMNFEGTDIGTSWYTTGFYFRSDLDPDPPSLTSTYTNLAPVADGIFSEGEWDYATSVELTEADFYNGLAAVMHVANNGTHLFVCFDVWGDYYEDGGDSSGISFDTGNDGVATDGAEDQFSVGPGITDGELHTVYDLALTDWVVDCSPFDPLLADHEGLAGAYGFGTSDEYYWDDHSIYEYSIPLALLGISAGDEIGFVAASEESPGANDDSWYWSCWPKYFDDMPDMELYGTLVTAEAYPNTDITLDGVSGWDEWWQSNVTVTLEAFGGDGGVDYTMYRVDGGDWTAYDAPFLVSGDGVHTLEYYSADVAGNLEPVHSVDLSIDSTAPTIDGALDGTAGLEGWYLGDVTVTLSVDDVTAGAGEIYYDLDGAGWEWYTAPFIVTGDGEHTIEYYSYDMAGNYIDGVPIEIGIDSVAPVCAAVYYAALGDNDWLVSQVEVNLTAFDVTSGVSEMLFSVDGGEWQTYNGNFTVGYDGIIDVEYTAVDVAGNQGAVTPFTLFVDLSAPETEASVVDDYDVTLNAVDNLSGVNYTVYSIDGGAWTVYSGEFTAGSSGFITVEYYSVDNAGNVEETKVLYLGDRTSPVTEPSLDGTVTPSDWYVSDVEVTLDAEDDESGVAQTMYSIDGGAWTAYDGPFELTTDGEHTVEFYSVDNVGNEEDEQSIDVSIDTIGPTTTASVEGTTVTLTASDATSGVSDTSYRIDGGDWILYNGAFEVTGAEGNHTVQFFSGDAAGNNGAIQNVTVVVEGDGGGVSMLMLGVIGLVVAAAVIGLVLFMMMRRKKGPPAPSQEPPAPEDLPPPPPQ